MNLPQVAITGVGEAGGGKRTGKTALALAAEAAFRALDDAGLAPRAVDAVLLENPMSEGYHMPVSAFLEFVGLQPRHHAAFACGGTTPWAMAIHGAALIAAGRARHVLVVDADSRSTRYTGDKIVHSANAGADIPQVDLPYYPTTPGRYALIAQRYLHEYGASPEHLAAVAVATRAFAARNPRALHRTPLTVADVLASPPVALPLRLLDCCLVSDWGTAFVLAPAAAAGTGPHPPVHLLGLGEAATGYNVATAPTLAALPGHESARQALAMAGVLPRDLDLAFIYDSFTIMVLLGLEELGICPPGTAGPLVAAGGTGPGGRWPVNTHGGQLSYQCGHGQYVVEAVRQLRGEAGARQVPGARLAACHGTAAVCQASYTLILGGPTR